MLFPLADRRSFAFLGAMNSPSGRFHLCATNTQVDGVQFSDYWGDMFTAQDPRPEIYAYLNKTQ